MVSVKVRRPSYDKKHLYGFNVPEFATYHGNIVETPKWVSYDALCLSAPKGAGIAFRIIPKEQIVSINDQVVEQNPIVESTFKTIVVKGSKGDTYIVTAENNNYSCTCSGFQFRKSCRHIAEAKSHG